jgi:putative ABC transport system permease protein
MIQFRIADLGLRIETNPKSEIRNQERIMFKSYLKIAFRNFLRQKVYSFINLTGLAVGIAGCLLILLFVRSELTYDFFHAKAPDIYRVAMKFNIGTNRFDVAMGPCSLSGAIVKDFPEVVCATRFFHRNYRGEYTYVSFEDKQFREEKFLWVDSTIFEIFTIPFVAGDPGTALKHPFSVVITPAMAKKYFGNGDPVGRMLTLEDGSLYQVTGIVEEMPVNSHIHYDFLASFSSLEKSRDPDWYDIAVYTYVLIQENAYPNQLEAKLPAFSREYYEPVVRAIMGISYDKFLESGNYIGFFLQPFRDIHLFSKIENEFEPGGDITTVVIFSAIAFIILLIACFNFINLATARSAQRANEVGVRKVAGSGRKRLIGQFLSESIFLSFISFLLAWGIVELFLPVFNSLIGKKITTPGLAEWYFLPGLIFAAIAVGILAGSYPAFLLSSFQPVKVLKGKLHPNSRGRIFRNALVVFQFTISIILFIGTMVIYNQLNYMRFKKLGFDKEQLVVIHSADKLGTEQQAFKNELIRNTNIVTATYSDCLPQMLLEVKVFQKEGAPGNENHNLITIFADYDFMETYRVQLSEGRYFSRERSTDTAAVILNEAAVKALELDNFREERLILMGRKNRPLNIIGIFENFHLESLHAKIRPMAAMFIDKRPGVLLSVRIRPPKIPETMRFLEDQWKKFVPEQPLEYIFLDEQFDKNYKAEIQTAKVITAFSFLAIFVACLGLFGLASFTALQRTKEIGIRKVLGASVSGIVLLLSKEFAKWVLLANIIAWPVAWFAMSNWLENFAYRTEISPWLFPVSGVIALIIALLTVSFQAIKAAIANPVNALKYE